MIAEQSVVHEGLLPLTFPLISLTTLGYSEEPWSCLAGGRSKPLHQALPGQAEKQKRPVAGDKMHREIQTSKPCPGDRKSCGLWAGEAKKGRSPAGQGPTGQGLSAELDAQSRAAYPGPSRQRKPLRDARFYFY